MKTTPAAGAGAALPRTVVAEDGRRMRLADEETLRYFLSRPLRPPMARGYSAELMRRVGLDDGEVATVLRASQAARDARRVHADVLEQYKARGYAYLEIPELYPDDDDDDEHAAPAVQDMGVS